MSFVSLTTKFVVVFASVALTFMVYARKLPTFKVVMVPSLNSKASGTVNFTQLRNKIVLIEGKLSGFTPGPHGFHVHENGDCSDPEEGFIKAGDQFRFEGTHHGSLEKGHLGDLGNVTADAKGRVKIKIKTNKIDLIDKDTISILGKSIIVHEGLDDEISQPEGNSGDRVLCGVIK